MKEELGFRTARFKDASRTRVLAWGNVKESPRPARQEGPAPTGLPASQLLPNGRPGKHCRSDNPVFIGRKLRARLAGHVSGYHMAVVAGVVFIFVRALLALVPPLAERFPIKKWAAAASLLAAAFYLVLSGAEVATQRAFIMTAIVLLGVILDRQALTAAHARGCRARRHDRDAGGGGASKFPDVVCGDARARRRL